MSGMFGRALTNLSQRGAPTRVPMNAGASLLGLGGGSPLTQPFTQIQGMAAYGGAGWLFITVQRIGSAMASVPWNLYRQKADGQRDQVYAHEALSLWRDVNPFFTLPDFIETFQQHLDLVGEAWWLLLRQNDNPNGKVVELWPLRPDRITPVRHPQEFIAGYVYRDRGTSIPLRREDIIFLRMPNPLDLYRGMGPVQTILADLDSERFSAQWNRNFFLNSAEPGGIIEFEEGLSDAEFDQFVMRWRSQHQGVSSAHRVAVLEKGKWVDRKYSMRDMQFEQMRRFNRDLFLGAFGLHKHMIGASDDVVRANAEAAEYMFARWVLVPRLERIRYALNERLLPAMGVTGFEFGYVDPTPENMELKIKIAKLGSETQSLTVNEIRRELGYDDIEGGDEIVPPINNPSLGSYGLPRLKGDGLLSDELEAIRAEMQRGWERRFRKEREDIIAHLEAVE